MAMCYVKFFYDWEAFITALSDAEAGALFKALLAWGARQQRLPLEGRADGIFMVLKSFLDRDRQSYLRAASAFEKEGGKGEEKEYDQDHEEKKDHDQGEGQENPEEKDHVYNEGEGQRKDRVQDKGKDQETCGEKDYGCGEGEGQENLSEAKACAYGENEDQKRQSEAKARGDDGGERPENREGPSPAHPADLTHLSPGSACTACADLPDIPGSHLAGQSNVPFVNTGFAGPALADTPDISGSHLAGRSNVPGPTGFADTARADSPVSSGPAFSHPAAISRAFAESRFDLAPRELDLTNSNAAKPLQGAPGPGNAHQAPGRPIPSPARSLAQSRAIESPILSEPQSWPQPAPTLAQVQSRIGAMGLDVDAAAFYDYYAARGWMLGNVPMRDLDACLRSWQRRDKKQARTVSAQQYCQRPYTEDELAVSTPSLLQEAMLETND